MTGLIISYFIFRDALHTRLMHIERNIIILQPILTNNFSAIFQTYFSIGTHFCVITNKNQCFPRTILNASNLYSAPKRLRFKFTVPDRYYQHRADPRNEHCPDNQGRRDKASFQVALNDSFGP